MYATFGFVAICILVLPLIIDSIWVKVLTSAAIFTLAAYGVSLLYSHLGLVNLSQVALVGAGGWIMLRLNYAADFPFEVNLLISAVITAFIGMVLALPAIRMKGLYLALITLMIAGGFQIILSAIQFPNGGSGFFGVALQSPGEMRRPVIAESDTAYLRYSIVIVVFGIMLAAAHKFSRPGRAWAMIRKSEANAMAAGVNVTFYKLWCFTLSGFLAGTAGGLLAGALKILDAKSFPAGESILLFALAIVGGVGHWMGAVIAGFLYRVLPAIFNNIGIDADLSLVIFGAALLHAIMTAPNGIAGQISTLFQAWGRQNK
ncbi:branched-chain amino acid ABC transporter permease [Sneathiella litorea]|uniref:Branched-chain amino acid ABC transporter permease n=1 Tax=Sneathiella litorea TaxID=2606216 RepID=A0A6L8W948_9PROT|nr:branched-chain amino acid ABC transporter permease [Sneathiella litorea]MZR31625.1 branched-chain amino acid ABC transporter permease [Sneathiella litorea]